MNPTRGARGPARDFAVRGRLRFAAGLIVTILVAFAALFPTPYFVIAPGTAVDLTERITVAGHAPAPDRYYLTDVTLRRASLAMLLARFVPGNSIVPEAELVPSGISSERYDAILVEAMNSSQDIAAVVAERAAGLPVHVPQQIVSIVRVLPFSRAQRELEAGDVMRAADGVPIHDVPTLARVLSRQRANEPIELAIVRGGRALLVAAPTIVSSGKRKLGIQLKLTQPRATIPVPVHYAMSDVAGSSGGLMFALAIYGSLKAGSRRQPPVKPSDIAGTGTLDLDGTVGEIEGTRQKLIAAKRAGARIFFVPRANYAEVEGDRDVRIIPVGSFREALAALRRDGIGPDVTRAAGRALSNVAPPSRRRAARLEVSKSSSRYDRTA